MSEERGAPDQVAGERDHNSVTRSLSVQSRVSNLLAIGLMSVLGLGSLTWYYANTLVRQGQAKQTATVASASRAQNDMPLPSLGHIAFPPLPLVETVPTPQVVPIDQTSFATQLPPMASAATAPKTPAQLATERELSGAVFESKEGATPVGDAAVRPPASGEPAKGELASLLRPTASTAVRAEMLPAQRLLLPKGAFIDCTLETAIDSTLPGMTTCVMAADAFGVDGNVVLLERGTKLIGETRGQVQQGAARIFVLWTEARSPTGVIVPLDSPGADELGRSGLPGEVNRHFWQRFGAAMLVSVIDGAVQAAAQSAHGGNGNVVLNPSSSQDVLTEILKNTINVPPTVVKHNGDRIQVLVARNLDFRSVYELRSVAAAR